MHLKTTTPPHRGENIIHYGCEPQQARHIMIMLHGRGASAQSMTSLADAIDNKQIHFIIPQATGFTWYPYRFIKKREANQPHLDSALTLIAAICDSLTDDGIAPGNLFFIGFSQGACLALDYCARNPKTYGGVFALSGGLIGEQINAKKYNGDMQNCPVFLGCADNDLHIPEERVYNSAAVFKNLNATVTTRIYPGMGHMVNEDEIDFIKQVLE